MILTSATELLLQLLHRETSLNGFKNHVLLEFILITLLSTWTLLWLLGLEFLGLRESVIADALCKLLVRLSTNRALEELIADATWLHRVL